MHRFLAVGTCINGFVDPAEYSSRKGKGSYSRLNTNRFRQARERTAVGADDYLMKYLPLSPKNLNKFDK